MPTMKSVDLIVRTRMGENHSEKVPAFTLSREELVLGCLRSLVRTAKNVDSSRFALRLVLLDDHSAYESVRKMRELLTQLPFESKFIPLGMSGVGPSFGSAYTYAKDAGGEFLYFVEDDYLHAPSALPEMLEAQELFSRNLDGKEVAIFPVDHPMRYEPQAMERAHLVVGPHRHWQVQCASTGTFLITKNAFMQNIDQCMKMVSVEARHVPIAYGPLNSIWRSGVTLFAPAPTLVLHMRDETTLSPFVDWKQWWNAYAN